MLSAARQDKRDRGRGGRRRRSPGAPALARLPRVARSVDARLRYFLQEEIISCDLGRAGLTFLLG